jgi:TRAP-type mannitol/chloroaromatic compound transport system permease small subunit
MVWISLSYVGNSWPILEGSAEVGGIPAVFLLKTLIPLTGVLLIFQGIAGIASILLAKYQA